jgi:hypothetical protein
MDPKSHVIPAWPQHSVPVSLNKLGSQALIIWQPVCAWTPSTRKIATIANKSDFSDARPRMPLVRPIRFFLCCSALHASDLPRAFDLALLVNLNSTHTSSSKAALCCLKLSFLHACAERRPSWICKLKCSLFYSRFLCNRRMKMYQQDWF